MADPDALDVGRLRRSALVAGVGDGVVAVAIPLLAAALTRDPLAVAGVVAAQHLPWVVLALALPALRGVDRRTLAGAGWSLCALAVALAGVSALIGNETILLLQLVAFAVGVSQALDDDAERVAGDSLGEHRSTEGSLAGAGMVGLGLVGLPLGGFLYEVLAPVPLLFTVGVFAVAGLLVLFLRRPLLHLEPPVEAPVEAGPSLLPKLQRGTGRVTLAAALVTAASGAVAGVLVLIALDDLGLGAPAFGFLLAGLAAATLVGALGAPALGSAVGLRNAAVAALVVAAVADVAAWSLLNPDLAVVPALTLGIAASAAMAAGVLLRAALHAVAGGPLGEEAGRAFHLVVWSATPAGALLGGVAARSFGSADVLLGAAATAAVAAVVAGIAAPQRVARERTPDPLQKTP